MSYIELKNICKSFKNGEEKTVVCDNFNLSISEHEMVAITGKSGCGKTTILNILAGIDNFESGKYYFDDNEISIKTTSDGVKFRKNRIGIILQHFALINGFTVFENIELGLWETNINKNEMNRKVSEVLNLLDIEKLKTKYPYQLSGGEKQRVAIGRAIIRRPLLLLADEPTGALDNETELYVIDLLKRINRDVGMTMVLVTHDNEVANKCSRTIHLEKK